MTRRSRRKNIDVFLEYFYVTVLPVEGHSEMDVWVALSPPIDIACLPPFDIDPACIAYRTSVHLMLDYDSIDTSIAARQFTEV